MAAPTMRSNHPQRVRVRHASRATRALGESARAARTRLPAALAALVASLSLVATRDAHATSVTEFPDNGSEQLARGGAWIARASDPLATFFNPAGLAGQDTRLTLQANLNFRSACFQRVRAANDTTQDGFNGEPYPEVCRENSPFPNPQLAVAWKITDRFGAGFSLQGPSSIGRTKWPETVPDAGGTEQPAPQRYLLMSGNLLFLTPTIGVGYEPVPRVRLGAAFQWGIARLQYSNASVGLNSSDAIARNNDLQAELTVRDFFVPGGVLGALWSPSDYVDVAAWGRVSDTIKARGDVTVRANYFSNAEERITDTSVPDCGHVASGQPCGDGKLASVRVIVPAEAKIGVRFHVPRDRATYDQRRRDPLAQDLFDIEVNFTYANNSAFDTTRVRFPGDDRFEGIIPINGTPGYLPPNADTPNGFKDVFGVRVGGDYNVLPDRLALRAGAFFESNGQDPTYQNISFMGGQRIGLAGGGTYRINLSSGARRRSLEFMAGFMHMFVADQRNDDPNGRGVLARAGSACPAGVDATNGPDCANGLQKYRTAWPVNLGTITNAVNVINIGAAYRF
jgi:long-chain fatty acid transport protein